MTPEVRNTLVYEMLACKERDVRYNGSNWDAGRAAGIHLALVLDLPNEPCGDPDCEYSDCKRLIAKQAGA